MLIFYAIDGTVIESITYKDYELVWKPIIPNTYGEYLSELVRDSGLLKKLYKEQNNLPVNTKN